MGDEKPGDIAAFPEKRADYHVGSGAEIGVSSARYAKLGYVHTGYGSASFLLDEDDEASFEVKTDRHQVFVDLGMRL